MSDDDAWRPGHAPAIRLANKAIIIRDGALLVVVNEADGEEFWLCPGGGQEWGETALAGIVRECQEEVGCAVVPGEVAFIRDYIGSHHEFARTDGRFHQLEVYWFCSLAPGAQPRVTDTRDTYQTGFRWVPLADLARAPLYPRALVSWLRLPPGQRSLYLGDVN